MSLCLIDWGKIMHPTYPTKCAYVEPKSGGVYAPAACPSPDRSAVSTARSAALRWLGVSIGGGGSGDMPAVTYGQACIARYVLRHTITHVY
jgi:hypothetical protein